MTTQEEYIEVFHYLVKHNPTMDEWYTAYTDIPHFYKVQGQLLKSFQLIPYLFEDDISKLELPPQLPQEIHDKAMEVLKDIDVKAVLLKIKLGV